MVLKTGNHAIHNGDFRGCISFFVDGTEHVIPASDVMDVAAEKIRSELIRSIEQMDIEKLLRVSYST